MGIVRKIVHIISYIIYFCIFVFLLVELPIIFGYKPLVVLSGSMEPNYKVGSIIYYHKVSQDQLKKGDVITFSLDNNKIVTHRINSINEDVIETKGDKNNVPDPNKIKFTSVLGKTSNFSIPFIGYCYVFFINNHVVFIGILIAILCLEFIFSNNELFKNKKVKEEKR